MRYRFVAIFVGLAAASGLLFACGSQCTLMACLYKTRVEMELPEGETVESAEGEVRVGDKVYPFACPRESHLDTVQCWGSTLTVDMGTVGKPKEMTLDIRVNDGRYAYKGKVRPAYGSSEINGPGCGFCDYGEAAIELVPVVASN